MNFRPCIDIHNSKVKQIVGSTLSDSGECPRTNFETELPPAYFANIYREDNLSGGHVIMLGKGNEQAAIDALRAYPGGFHVGGGITPENASVFLDAGASHVIITSYVFSQGRVQWERLQELSRKVGKERLVLDLSCKRRQSSYFVVTDRWQNFTDVALSAETFEKLAFFCDEFLVHAADVEGKCGGIDEELLELLASSVPILATYAGGIRSIDDIERVKSCGAGRIDYTIGSALDLFGGSLPYDDVLIWHKRQNGL